MRYSFSVCPFFIYNSFNKLLSSSSNLTITKRDVFYVIKYYVLTIIKNEINKLCFCRNNYFRNYRHPRNFEAYFPVRNFSACYTRTTCSGSRKYSVSYYYNYCNPVPNKRSKIDKKSRCEKGLFLLSNHRLFLYHHYYFFGHYLFQHHYHQKNRRNVSHLIIII